MCGFDASSTATAGNVVGTLAQMKAARDQATYQANIANQNAAIASAQAVSVGQQGANEQANIRKRARQIAGTQKAGFAANGLDTSSGSALAVLSDTAYQGEQDAQMSRYNTALQMWGLNNQAAQYRSQAKYAKQAGSNAATSSLLTGLTTAAKQYSTLNNNLSYNKKQSNNSIKKYDEFNFAKYGY